MIKTPSYLQGLRPRIYDKEKAEAVGKCGVEADHQVSPRKHCWPWRSHKACREADKRAECGKSARSVRRGGGWKRTYGRVSEALPKETGRNR